MREFEPLVERPFYRRIGTRATALVLSLAVAGGAANAISGREIPPQQVAVAEELVLESETVTPEDPTDEVVDTNELRPITAAGSEEMPCEPGEVINKVKTSEKKVALTIDDGPSPSTTPEILEVLSETDTVATFFFVGERLETEEGKALAEQVLDEGHEIAGHSYSHRLFTPEVNGQEHDQGNEVFKEVLGTVPYGYRAPGFGYTDLLRKKVTDANQCFIGMSLHGDTLDWKSDFLPENEALAALKANSDVVIDNLSPGTIILAHDQIKDSPEDGGRNRERPFAAENIRHLIEGIKAEGYMPVTVEDLLNEN